MKAADQVRAQADRHVRMGRVGLYRKKDIVAGISTTVVIAGVRQVFMIVIASLIMV